MQRDRYDNLLSTQSPTARDHYVEGLDRFLAARAGVEAAFEAAIEADDGFALAHLALARVRQAMGRGEDRLAPLARARELAGDTTVREQAHIDAMGDLVAGDAAGGYRKIRTYLVEHPRDVLLARLLRRVRPDRFQRQAGRETEQLACLAPAYGEDWWFAASTPSRRSKPARPGRPPRRSSGPGLDPITPWRSYPRPCLLRGRPNPGRLRPY